jgi:hypothetical protein
VSKGRLKTSQDRCHVSWSRWWWSIWGGGGGIHHTVFVPMYHSTSEMLDVRVESRVGQSRCWSERWRSVLCSFRSLNGAFTPWTGRPAPPPAPALWPGAMSHPAGCPSARCWCTAGPHCGGRLYTRATKLDHPGPCCELMLGRPVFSVLAPEVLQKCWSLVGHNVIHTYTKPDNSNVFQLK